jgi:hypothetical protein
LQHALIENLERIDPGGADAVIGNVEGNVVRVAGVAAVAAAITQAWPGIGFHQFFHGLAMVNGDEDGDAGEEHRGAADHDIDPAMAAMVMVVLDFRCLKHPRYSVA